MFQQFSVNAKGIDFRKAKVAYKKIISYNSPIGSDYKGGIVEDEYQEAPKL